MAQNKKAQAAKTAKASARKPNVAHKAASAKASGKAKAAPKAAVKSKSINVKLVKPVKKASVKTATVSKVVSKAAPKVVKPADVKSVAAAKPIAQAVKKPVGVAAVKAAPVKSTISVGAQPVAAAKPVINPAAQIAAAQARAAAGGARAVPAAVQKSAAQKISAPVPTAVTPAATPKAIAEKTAAARQMVTAQQKKPVNQRHGFKANEYIVYPSHGVGRIVGIEEQEIAGMTLELFVITFEKEKLTLRVPTGKLQSVGMRKLAEDGVLKKALEVLKGRARIKRTMWSRRAQEYVAKINSGDLVSIAEVVRDLYRSEAQPEQSYSERQLYEDALDRMARELAAVEKLDERGAVQRITDILSKSAKGRRLAAGEGESEAEAESESEGDSEVVEAA